MQVMESDRLGSYADPAVRAGFERHLARLKADAAEVDRLRAEARRARPAIRLAFGPRRPTQSLAPNSIADWT
jgi:hypothetical protein